MTYQDIYLDTAKRPVPMAIRPVVKVHAPGRTFDRDPPDGCLALCLGVCHIDKQCPFLGCMADSSRFNPGCPSPTLN